MNVAEGVLTDPGIKVLTSVDGSVNFDPTDGAGEEVDLSVPPTPTVPLVYGTVRVPAGPFPGGTLPSGVWVQAQFAVTGVLNIATHVVGSGDLVPNIDGDYHVSYTATLRPVVLPPHTVLRAVMTLNGAPGIGITVDATQTDGDLTPRVVSLTGTTNWPIDGSDALQLWFQNDAGPPLVVVSVGICLNLNILARQGGVP